MSYILDALRRADSERERGTIPSLHTKAEALIDAEDDEGFGSRPHPLLWAVIGLSVVLAGVLAWQFMGNSPAEPAPMPAFNQTPAPVVPAPTPAPAPVPASVPPPMATIAPPTPQPEPPVAMAPARPVPQAPVQAAPRKQPARVTAKASAPVPASTAAPERPVQTLNELPENIRRELPQIAVGGAMYSENAANRMLIINGQVFHEGDKVAGELVLEQIKLKTAVLAYKGYRYGISY
jgi:general secretion pathway protein B